MAGTEYKLKAVFGCVDQISPKLREIRGKLSGMNSVFGRVADAASGFANAIAIPLAMIGGSGLFSIKKAIDNFTEFGDSIDKASKKAGVSVKSLQVLRTAASLGGMSSEQMDKSLQKLSMTMSDVVAGSNKGAAQMFSRLGIAMRDSSGNARSASDVMRDLAEAIKNNQSQTARMQILSSVFGKRMAADLIPVLQDGAAHLDQLADSAEKSGLLLSEADVKGAAHLKDSMTKMSGTMTKVSAIIGARMAPVVDSLVGKFTELLVTNKELIASKLDLIFNRLADIIESIDFQAIINGLDVLFTVLMNVFDAIGGFDGLASVFAVWMGNKCVIAVASLGKALGDLWGILTANPWAAVAVLAVYAAIQIWRNWENIVAWFRETFPQLSQVIMALPQAIAGAFQIARTVVSTFFSWLRSAIPDWLVNLLTGNIHLPSIPGFSGSSAAPVGGRNGKGELTVRVLGDKNVKTQTEYQGNVENAAYGDGYNFYP